MKRKLSLPSIEKLSIRTGSSSKLNGRQQSFTQERHDEVDEEDTPHEKASFSLGSSP